MNPIRLVVRKPTLHLSLARRPFSATTRFALLNNPDGNPNIVPNQIQNDDEPEEKSQNKSSWRNTGSRMLESALTTFASLSVLGAAGYGYHLYYKSLVLRKMSKAFDPGDPVLDLAAPTPSSKPSHMVVDGEVVTGAESATWIEQPEQQLLDDVMAGNKQGRYYLLIGEKGTGKSSMIIESMRKVQGDNISMFEAHADLEIFRVRLGKSLNYEFYEDYIGSLFSVRGPRDTTALLDIERAFNKLEKIALQRRERGRKPMVMIINCAHLIRDDSDGRDLIELIQQRAESWAASNLVTFVFNSDDYWVYERLKRYATRMEVITVRDLPKPKALAALANFRHSHFPHLPVDRDELSQVYDLVGGRVNYLSRVAKHRDMLETCREICQNEKTWFLNRCGVLGSDMDDDVMDQQKFASAAMVLAKALVDQAKEMDTTYDPEIGHILPNFPLYRAREIMTRADFIQAYDHDNIFTIDSNANVRADSVPMMNAFKEICASPGFDEYLQDTLDRISAIESLGRTREITLKDIWGEQNGEMKGAYEAVLRDNRGRETGRLELRVKPDPRADDDDEDKKGG